MGLDKVKRDLALKVDHDVNSPASIMLAKSVLGALAGAVATLAVRAGIDAWASRQVTSLEDEINPETTD